MARLPKLRAPHPNVVWTPSPLQGAALLGIAYFGFAELSLRNRLAAQNTALFWLGSGLSLAVLAKAPPRSWGALLGAVGAACGVTNWLHGFPWTLNLGYTAANLVEPIVGALLIGALPKGTLGRPVQGLMAVLTAAPVACFAGACLATAVSALVAGAPDDASPTWTFRLWFVDDLLGVVLVAPLVLAWWPGSEWQSGRQGAAFWAELAAVLAAMLFLAAPVFLTPGSSGFRIFGPEMVLPALLWAALRLGPRGASIAAFALAVVAVVVSAGHGPFANPTAPTSHRAIALQLYLAVVTVCAMTPAVLLHERLRTEAQVRARERDLGAVLRSLGEGVVTTDRRGIVQRMNPAAEAILGVSAADARGQSFRDLLGSLEKTGDAVRALDRALDGITVVRNAAELHLQATDGPLRTVLQTVSPLHDESGTALGAVIVLADITDAREQQRKLTAIAQQLQQSQKLEAVGLLASGVAHDFNNMLTAVQASGELLRAEVPSTSADLVDEILQAAERARQLTQRLLTFGGRQPIRPEPIELRSTLASFKKTLLRVVGDGVVVQFEGTEPLPSLLLDRTQLEQLVLNLAINARDAMPNGGLLRVRTRLERLDADRLVARPELRPGPFVCLEVSDTGHGMDDTTLTKIFEPFFTTKAVGKGTGLGLATVYGVVSQHGGFIEVRSKPGAGTTFLVWFPVPASETTKYESSAPPTSAEHREHLLYVEDDPQVRRLTLIILERLGYRVTAADGPDCALRIVAEGLVPDLLLSDVVMPDMNGYEMYVAMKQYIPDLRAVFVSGYSESVFSDGFSKEDRPRVLTKPFSAERLAAALRESLDERSRAMRPPVPNGAVAERPFNAS